MKIGVHRSDTPPTRPHAHAQSAELWRNKGGDMAAAFRALQSRDIAAYATNRQRLQELSQRHAGLRLLAENFYGVEHRSSSGRATQGCSTVANVPEDARASGLTASAIARSGIVGLDVAPPRAQQTAPGRRTDRRTDLKEPSAV